MSTQNIRSTATLTRQTNDDRYLSNALLISLALFAFFFAMPSLAIAAGSSNSSEHGLKAHQLEFNQTLRMHVANLDSLLGNNAVDADKLNADVVVVTFFASWCPPCRDEFKALNEVNAVLADRNVSVIAINAFEEFDDNDKPRLEKFLQQTAPQFQVVKGTEDTLALFGGINRIPTLFVFDKSGKQAYNFVHARGATKMSAESDELLAAITPLLEK